MGQSLREGNIWENVELPHLMGNDNVTKITTIDPVSQTEKVIFVMDNGYENYRHKFVCDA